MEFNDEKDGTVQKVEGPQTIRDFVGDLTLGVSMEDIMVANSNGQTRGADLSTSARVDGMIVDVKEDVVEQLIEVAD